MTGIPRCRFARGIVVFGLLCNLFGCAVRNYEYSPELREVAMRGYLDKEMRYESAILHPEYGLMAQRGSLSSFLQAHSGLVFSAAGHSIEEIQSALFAENEVLERREEESGVSVVTSTTTVHFDGSKLGNEVAHSAGHCVAVATDGYFISAEHVVDVPEAVMVYSEYDFVNDMEAMRVVPFRLVFSDPDIDFAIIKAELSCAFILKMADQTPEWGTNLFGGGWLNDIPAAGKMFQSREIEDAVLPDGSKAREVISVVPVLRGDSGSPLIDEEGRMHGVISSIVAYKQYRNRDFTRAVNVPQEFIESIIEGDRAAARDGN